MGGGGGASPPPPPPSSQTLSTAHEDQLRRALADLDNLRKRYQRERPGSARPSAPGLPPTFCRFSTAWNELWTMPAMLTPP